MLNGMKHTHEVDWGFFIALRFIQACAELAEAMTIARCFLFSRWQQEGGFLAEAVEEFDGFEVAFQYVGDVVVHDVF